VHTYNAQLSLLVNDTFEAVYFDDADSMLYEQIAYYSEILGIPIEI
jgi:hypothetical protein